MEELAYAHARNDLQTHSLSPGGGLPFPDPVPGGDEGEQLVSSVRPLHAVCASLLPLLRLVLAARRRDRTAFPDRPGQGPIPQDRRADRPAAALWGLSGVSGVGFLKGEVHGRRRCRCEIVQADIPDRKGWCGCILCRWKSRRGMEEFVNAHADNLSDDSVVSRFGTNVC